MASGDVCFASSFLRDGGATGVCEDDLGLCQVQLIVQLIRRVGRVGGPVDNVSEFYLALVHDEILT